MNRIILFLLASGLSVSCADTQNNLEDTRLTAPFDGYVQTVHAERNQDIKPSMPVVTFIDLNRIKIETCVPDTGGKVTVPPPSPKQIKDAGAFSRKTA